MELSARRKVGLSRTGRPGRSRISHSAQVSQAAESAHSSPQDPIPRLTSFSLQSPRHRQGCLSSQKAPPSPANTWLRQHRSFDAADSDPSPLQPRQKNTPALLVIPRVTSKPNARFWEELSVPAQVFAPKLERSIDQRTLFVSPKNQFHPANE